MFTNPKPLIVCTEDRDVLAAVADLINTPVIHSWNVEDTAQFAREVRGGGIAAYGPDIVDHVAAAPTWPTPFARAGVVLHAGRRPLNTLGVHRLAVVNTIELPDELCWLLDLLGVVTPIVRNTA